MPRKRLRRHRLGHRRTGDSCDAGGLLRRVRVRNQCRSGRRSWLSHLVRGKSGEEVEKEGGVPDDRRLTAAVVKKRRRSKRAPSFLLRSVGLSNCATCGEGIAGAAAVAPSPRDPRRSGGGRVPAFPSGHQRSPRNDRTARTTTITPISQKMLSIVGDTPQLLCSSPCSPRSPLPSSRSASLSSALPGSGRASALTSPAA